MRKKSQQPKTFVLFGKSWQPLYDIKMGFEGKPEAGDAGTDEREPVLPLIQLFILKFVTINMKELREIEKLQSWQNTSVKSIYFPNFPPKCN